MASYIPRQGDLIPLDFTPQSGHGQKDRRPELVVSKEVFNKSTETAIYCPITNTNQQILFHIPIAERTSLTRFVMYDQVKSLDFRSRGITLIEKLLRKYSRMCWRPLMR
jgi:mRNA interferase MazF